MRRFFDATLGKWTRHFLFVILRLYYALFYNVSCSNNHLLQGQPGTLILDTHVSRHDGPLIATILYTTMRIRPTVHYTEYYSWAQWLPMFVTSSIPMSSPKEWAEDRRRQRKEFVLDVIRKVLANGNSILMFPAGGIRKQPQEVIPPFLSGAHEILQADPETPVVVLRLDGLGAFQHAKFDLFWSFLGLKKGRRHISVDIQPIEGLDPTLERSEFNKTLEDLLNR